MTMRSRAQPSRRLTCTLALVKILNMKSLLLILCSFLTFSASAQVEWLSWEEAIERNKTEPKRMLVDVYTDWCGWCKKMDKVVFTDPAIAKVISKNFYAVKFNAEQRKAIEWSGHTFSFNENMGRRGAHELAYSLLDGRMSYPSIVYLDDHQSRISISPGFKPADKYINELNFINGGHYRTMNYQEYLKTLGK